MRGKGGEEERKREKAKISRRHVDGNPEKTLRRKAGAMAKKKPTAPAPVAGAFTVRELAAAKRLILLSGSSTSSSLGARSGAVAAASSGSSVNAPQAVPPRPPAEDYLSDEELEDESQEVPGIQRRTRLYRLVSEIYQVTEPMEEEPADDESGRKETATKTKK